MGAERHERVKQVFAGAVDLDAGGRARLPGPACGSDSELGAEVERLLAEYDRPGGFLDTLVVSSSPALETPRPELAGNRAVLEGFRKEILAAIEAIPLIGRWRSGSMPLIARASSIATSRVRT